jgi:hypothetical protein
VEICRYVGIGGDQQGGMDELHMFVDIKFYYPRGGRGRFIKLGKE